MIHRTFRSLDQAPKLVGFTVPQWALLITGASTVLGFVYLAHLPTKPAITLFVFLVGLPAALTYVSESGGLQLGGLLRDLCGWRLHRRSLAAVGAGFDGGCGVVVLAQPDEHATRAGASLDDLAENSLRSSDQTLESLLDGERWLR